jgi:hypothetical protein
MPRSGMVSLPKWSKNLFPFFLSLFITSILPIQFADAAADQWISTGSLAGGETLALAINPTSPNIVYAGSYSHGVYKTSLSVGDFNADGNTDILWTNTSGGEIYVWYMNGAAFNGYSYIMAVTDQTWTIVGPK